MCTNSINVVYTLWSKRADFCGQIVYIQIFILCLGILFSQASTTWKKAKGLFIKILIPPSPFLNYPDFPNPQSVNNLRWGHRLPLYFLGLTNMYLQEKKEICRLPNVEEYLWIQYGWQFIRSTPGTCFI